MMADFINDKFRLGFAILLIVGAIVTFIYGFMEKNSGNEFNQIWTLALVMLVGAKFICKKLGIPIVSKITDISHVSFCR